MHRILMLGAGKIGSLAALLLAASESYTVYLADTKIENDSLTTLSKKFPNLKLVLLNAENHAEIKTFLKTQPVDAIASCLPYFHNILIIQIAKEFNLHYFDLTEDTKIAEAVAIAAQSAYSAFIPQCGLAPGLLAFAANDLMQSFSELDTVKLRVGALPMHISNALQYALTWSTDGLINQYANPCYAIENGKEITAFPLDNLEEIELDGLMYEAFNTSGGIGTLAKSYAGKVKNLNYKTIRYPGHCDKMRFLMNDLKLNQDRKTLKHILENALPHTFQDVVLIYISVTGKINNQFCEKNYVRKFYSQIIYDTLWSAIQIMTASSLCAVIDIVLKKPEKYHGLVKQELFSLSQITTNIFGKYYA